MLEGVTWGTERVGFTHCRKRASSGLRRSITLGYVTVQSTSHHEGLGWGVLSHHQPDSQAESTACLVLHLLAFLCSLWSTVLGKLNFTNQCVLLEIPWASAYQAPRAQEMVWEASESKMKIYQN